MNSRNQPAFNPFSLTTLALSIVVIFFCIGCNNDNSSASPFESILAQQPYALVSDSIRDQPKNDELYFHRAVLLNKNNLPEPAMADFQKAWSLKKQERYAFGITTIWLDKKPDSAIIFLEEALKELPESYLLKMSLARAYDKLNNTLAALQAVTQLQNEHPDKPEVLILQSEILEKKGDRKGALSALEKAYRIGPVNWQQAFNLAYKYAENKDPKCLELCDSFIKKDSLKLYADPFYVKGIYYTNIQDWANALRFFDETIKRDYNYLNAYIEKGKILLDRKKTAEAFQTFSLANRIKPAFPDAWYWIGVCQEALGQKEEAKLSYEKAYGLDKSFEEARVAATRLGGKVD
ncbi:MAG: tetratricopeptide repeat protein [Chitinophagaceae bacterium]|nr:tetratricopeptide repeat protein [Chitinophagaceae bacterium]